MKNLENKEIFARNLRRFLDARGMQDKDLVEVTGASQTAISDWLNAKKYPRIDKIEKMAVFFGVKKSDLIEEQTRDEHEAVIKQLVEMFNALPDEGKERTMEYLQFLTLQVKNGKFRVADLLKNDE